MQVIRIPTSSWNIPSFVELEQRPGTSEAAGSSVLVWEGSAVSQQTSTEGVLDRLSALVRPPRSRRVTLEGLVLDFARNFGPWSACERHAHGPLQYRMGRVLRFHYDRRGRPDVYRHGRMGERTQEPVEHMLVAARRVNAFRSLLADARNGQIAERVDLVALGVTRGTGRSPEATLAMLTDTVLEWMNHFHVSLSLRPPDPHERAGAWEAEPEVLIDGVGGAVTYELYRELADGAWRLARCRNEWCRTVWHPLRSDHGPLCEACHNQANSRRYGPAYRRRRKERREATSAR